MDATITVAIISTVGAGLFAYAERCRASRAESENRRLSDQFDDRKEIHIQNEQLRANLIDEVKRSREYLMECRKECDHIRAQKEDWKNRYESMEYVCNEALAAADNLQCRLAGLTRGEEEL